MWGRNPRPALSTGHHRAEGSHLQQIRKEYTDCVRLIV